MDELFDEKVGDEWVGRMDGSIDRCMDTPMYE